jgi:hypothetical protein
LNRKLREVYEKWGIRKKEYVRYKKNKNSEMKKKRLDENRIKLKFKNQIVLNEYSNTSDFTKLLNKISEYDPLSSKYYLNNRRKK